MKPCVGGEDWAVSCNKFEGLTCDICTYGCNDNTKKPFCDNCLINCRHDLYAKLVNLLEVG